MEEEEPSTLLAGISTAAARVWESVCRFLIYSMTVIWYARVQRTPSAVMGALVHPSVLPYHSTRSGASPDIHLQMDGHKNVGHRRKGLFFIRIKMKS